MSAMIARLRRRVGAQHGASTVEFLMTLLGVMALFLLLVQTFFVFMHAIVVNHALSLTSHEVSARGGLTDTVRDYTFRKHLTPDLRRCYDDGLQTNMVAGCQLATFDQAGNPLGDSLGIGAEAARSEEVIKLEFTYYERLSFVAPFLEPFGIDATIPMRRSVNVSSQSARENR